MDFQDVHGSDGETPDTNLAGGKALAAAVVAAGRRIVLQPNADNVVVLPEGATLDDLAVQGRDIVITLADGRVFVIPDGAVYVPQIVVDNVAVPPLNLAALLTGNEPQPAAGPVQSSGGNFADPTGPIQAAYGLGDLLPYTELSFAVQQEQEVLPALINEGPDVVIETPDNPAGAINAIATVDEEGLPARGDEPAGTAAETDAETTTGTIVFHSPDGTSAVLINGEEITAIGQSFTSPFGTMTITSIDIEGGEIGFSYTLADNLLGVTADGFFTMTVVDADGDTASATLQINVVDDGPIGFADTNTVTAGTFGPVQGNVITNDVPGADGFSGGGDTAVTGFASATQTGAPGDTISGTYGELTLNADGSYSYTRLPGTPGGVEDHFTYSIVDSDGTAATNIDLTIEIGDASPAIISVPEIGDGTEVNENQLPPTTDTRSDETPGSQFVSGPESTTGTITFHSDDGVSSVSLGGTVITPGALPQVVASDGTGTLTVVGYTFDPATGDGSVTYVYTLNDNTANTDGSTVSFDIIVVDADGDAASDSLDIHVIDDVPTAASDSGSVAEGGTLTVLADGVLGNDIAGADGATITGVAAGSDTSAPVTGNVGTAIAGAYGTLTLNADGSYSYASTDNGVPPAGASDTFVYTLTDGDGDTSTTTLTIALSDSGLAASNEDAAVNEAALGTGSNPSSSAETVTGTLADNASGGVGGLTYALVGSNTGSHGTITLNPNGSWSYTLTSPVDGADADDGANTEGNVETFTYEVTDANGNTVQSTITIDVIDDVPTAASDSGSLTEDTASVGGNVLTNDIFGADGPDGTQQICAVSGTGAGVVGGNTAGTHGTLQLNLDGSYTYLLNTAAVQGLDDGEQVTDTFSYTIKDGDGDTSTAQLTVTINGANDAPLANDDTNWVLDVTSGPNPTTEGNVLQSIDHAGAPAGTFADVADTDVDVEGLTVTAVTGGTVGNSVAGSHGSILINANGSYTYTLNASGSAVNALGAGETLTDTFTYTVSDGTATDTATVTITIFGTNDAPVVTGSAVAVSEEGLSGGVTDDNPTSPTDADTTDSASASGSITVTDADTNDTFTITLGTPTQTLYTSDGLTALTWLLSGDGHTLKGYSTDSDNPEILVTIDDDGNYTVTLGGPVRHADTTIEDLTSFVIPVLVNDGTTTTTQTNGITVTIEDDSPVVEASGNMTLSSNDLSGTGTFDYAIGADGRINFSSSSTDFSIALSGSVGAASIVNPTVTWASESATSATFNFTFQYDGNPTDNTNPLTSETGTITFDKVAGTYTVTLNEPIATFDTLTTGQTISSTSYNIVGSSEAQPEIVVSQLDTDFYVRFTGINGGLNAGGNSTFSPGEVFAGTQDWVSISGSENGVASDTLQNGEVLNMDFYTSSPGGTTTPGFPDGRADNIFIKVDQLNSNEDLVVVLKLIDPDSGTLTTKAIVVDAGDIWTSSETNPYGITFTDGSDGVIIIESNDYNFGAENYQIYGVQLLTSTGGVTGTDIAIDLNRATGTSGASTENTESFTSGQPTDDNDVIKIVDIGFVRVTTNTQEVHLDFDVTVTDADGDATQTVTLQVNPMTPPVALDLNGDGHISFLPLADGVTHDYGSGTVNTAWVGPEDGFLGHAVDGGVDIVFTDDAPGAETDLEGLRLAYDSNGDGKLTASDADFGDFGVWQDANSNGIVDAGEYQSLLKMGITSIDLNADGPASTELDGEVVISGTGQFTMKGATYTLADVSLATTSADDRIAARTTEIAAISLAAAGFLAGEAVHAQPLPPVAVETVMAALQTFQANVPEIPVSLPDAADGTLAVAAMGGEASQHQQTEPVSHAVSHPSEEGARQGLAEIAQHHELGGDPQSATDTHVQAGTTAISFGGGDGALMQALLLAVQSKDAGVSGEQKGADLPAVKEAIAQSVEQHSIDTLIDHFAAHDGPNPVVPIDAASTAALDHALGTLLAGAGIEGIHAANMAAGFEMAAMAAAAEAHTVAA